MAIWRQTINELHVVLEREGAFRNVRTYGLVTESERARVYTGKSWSLQNRRECSPLELVDPGGQRLILIATDCVSQGWDKDNGSVSQLLITWGRSNPIAIIQMLPQRLWLRTSLRDSVPVRLRASSPGMINTQLIAQATNYWDTKDPPIGLPVPIVTLEPRSLSAWSRAIARAEDIWIPGFMFDIVITPGGDADGNEELAQEEQSSITHSPQERINRFRATSSPTAYKLASLLATVPVSLPVIRLIQQTMLSASRQMHVAEVLLGGLLEEMPSKEVNSDPDYKEYDFIDGVRDLLLGSLTVGESLEVLSNFIESRSGQSFDFQALLANPLALEGIFIGKDARPFAHVAAKVLHRLGGKYAVLAKLFEGVANAPQQSSMGQLLDGNEQTLESISEQTEAERLAIGLSNNVLSEEQNQSVTYRNAKVVLVGDSGVGKSGLSLVLTKQPFVPTKSTHGRRVLRFDNQEVVLKDGRKETHETMLWDLAGQPGYRLIHQLHLNEVSVALVVFDSHSETDPFAGVPHWMRELRIAQRVQGNAAPAMKKLLIAARIDRGGKSVSRERIEAVVQELGFDGYFETSAKIGWSIAELREAIKHAIDWERIPKVTSTYLFQRIRTFLIAQKKLGACSLHLMTCIGRF